MRIALLWAALGLPLLLFGLLAVPVLWPLEAALPHWPLRAALWASAAAGVFCLVMAARRLAARE